MTLLALEFPMHATLISIDGDSETYRRIAERYRDQVKIAPRKRCIVAITVAAEEFGFTIAELRIRNRKQPVVTVRQKIMALASVISGGSTYEIGHFLDREHTTVMHAIDKYQTQVVLALGGKYESGK